VVEVVDAGVTAHWIGAPVEEPSTMPFRAVSRFEVQRSRSRGGGAGRPLRRTNPRFTKESASAGGDRSRNRPRHAPNACCIGVRSSSCRATPGSRPLRTRRRGRGRSSGRDALGRASSSFARIRDHRRKSEGTERDTTASGSLRGLRRRPRRSLGSLRQSPESGRVCG
jgi:hypothetical protein